MIHARIQEFSSGGGRGSIWHIKKLWQRFFFHLFFSPQFNNRSPVITFKENYYLQRFQWGGTFARAGPTFYRGSNCFYPIETHITCDFPGGPDRLPPSPLDPPMWFRASWFNLSTCTRFSLFFFNITFANSSVERGGNVASAAVLAVEVVIRY